MPLIIWQLLMSKKRYSTSVEYAYYEPWMELKPSAKSKQRSNAMSSKFCYACKWCCVVFVFLEFQLFRLLVLTVFLTRFCYRCCCHWQRFCCCGVSFWLRIFGNLEFVIFWSNWRISQPTNRSIPIHRVRGGSANSKRRSYKRNWWHYDQTQTQSESTTNRYNEKQSQKSQRSREDI